MKLNSLRGQRALQEIRNLEIKAERDPREKLEHGDFGTEPVPNRAKLEADCACSDDEKLFWRFIKTQRFRAADYRFAVKRHARQVDRHAASRDHDMITGDLVWLAVVRLDPHL